MNFQNWGLKLNIFMKIDQTHNLTFVSLCNSIVSIKILEMPLMLEVMFPMRLKWIILVRNKIERKWWKRTIGLELNEALEREANVYDLKVFPKPQESEPLFLFNFHIFLFLILTNYSFHTKASFDFHFVNLPR